MNKLIRPILLIGLAILIGFGIGEATTRELGWTAFCFCYLLILLRARNSDFDRSGGES